VERRNVGVLPDFSPHGRLKAFLSFPLFPLFFPFFLSFFLDGLCHISFFLITRGRRALSNPVE
jgi:hypothetical protein